MDCALKYIGQTGQTFYTRYKEHIQVIRNNNSNLGYSNHIFSVYQIKCMDCALKYIGQTGQTFYTKYKEHIQVIRNNNSNLGYSNHIFSMRHAHGSITDTMKNMKIEKKGKHLNTLEKYHIYM
jgi:hypothetical protein